MKEKKMTFMDLYLTGVGLTIGAGVVSTVGPAVGITGRSVWLAYLVAIVVGMLTIIPKAMFSATFVVKGGDYSCVRNCLGDTVGGVYACVGILNGFNYATFAIASGQYITGLVPSIPAKAVALTVLITFYVLNMFGLNVFVKVQSVMTWVLVAALMAFGVYGLFHLDPLVFKFSDPSFLAGGMQGFFQAVTMFMFSTVAYGSLLNFSGKAAHPRQDIPKAMAASLVTIIIVYSIVSITAGGILPPEQVAGKTLTVLAEAMWGKALAVLFVLAGPLMALFTTLNGNFASMAAPQLRAAQDGIWPSLFKKTTSRGAPWVVYSVCFCMALIPILLDYSVSEITGNMTILFQVNNMFLCMAMTQIPKKFPEAWEGSTFHCPPWLFYTIVALGVGGFVFAAYVQMRALRPIIVLITLAGYAIVLTYYFIRKKLGYIHMAPPVAFELDEDQE